MKTLHTFWNVYKKSWWLPSGITLGLAYLPTLFVLLTYLFFGPIEAGWLPDSPLIFVGLGFLWLLLILSALAMVMTGAYQIRSGAWGKGFVNLFVALAIIAKFWLLVFSLISVLQNMLSL